MNQCQVKSFTVVGYTTKEINYAMSELDEKANYFLSKHQAEAVSASLSSIPLSGTDAVTMIMTVSYKKKEETIPFDV